jgi:hypothetical protein
VTDFRAHVQRGNFQNLSLELTIWGPAVTDLDGTSSLNVKELATAERSTVFEKIPQHASGNVLRIDEDVAKALMLGLLEYFGEYKGDVRVLRQDYQAERKRVDKFIDYMITRPGEGSR